VIGELAAGQPVLPVMGGPDLAFVRLGEVHGWWRGPPTERDVAHIAFLQQGPGSRPAALEAEPQIGGQGQFQVGAFGGAMISGMTRELGMADSTIKILAKADFEKTKSLTYRFERPEVRILAKMMVLRAVLGEKNASKADNDLRVMSDLEN